MLSISGMTLMPLIRLSPLLALVAFSWTTSLASAQDTAVVQRLMQHGQMPRDDARALLRKIDAQMEANAEAGGDRYDDLRQQTNTALFGAQAGPGQGRAEYDQRLAQVFDRLRSGLDLATLQVYFRRRSNASVLCANEWGVTMGECDALIAAATLTRTALPYLAPDDGRELESTLRGSRVNRRLAHEIAEKLHATMLGVPQSLRNDADGRIMLQLLQACPGGSSDREAQIRSWHVGPTEGMAQCIAGAMTRHGGADTAARLFGMSPRAARAFVEYGARSNPTPAVAVNTPPVEPPRNTTPRVTPPRNTGSPQVTQMSSAQALRNQGAAFARGGLYPNAAASYQAALEAEPRHAATLVALGGVKLAMRDFAGAVACYQQAVQIEGTNDTYYVALGRALAQSNQREAAIAALQHAMEINYDNMQAREGLRALEGDAPPPPLPEIPERQQIQATMGPLRGAVQGCAPAFTGRVDFALTITGDTGEVLEVAATGEMTEDERYCMESVVQSARFPRFIRDTLEISYPIALRGR